MLCCEININNKETYCKELNRNAYDKVYYNPSSGNVYDGNKNLIGKGVMEKGKLIVTKLK